MTEAAVFICGTVESKAEEFVAKKLSETESAAIADHLATCGSCRELVNCFRAVHGLIEFVQAEPKAAPPPPPESLLDRAAGAPWWMASALFHILLIVLVSLATMSVAPPPLEDQIVMVTELSPNHSLKTEEKRAKDEGDAIAQTFNKPQQADLQKEIVIPPDILAKAIVSDHFETVNPDRPDTHSAFGNPDAQIIYDMRGNDGAAGGGGLGGMALDGMIGIGGNCSPGSGGGYGGGNGTGIGTGDGPGTGSFGSAGGGGRVFSIMGGSGMAGSFAGVKVSGRRMALIFDASASMHAVIEAGKVSLREFLKTVKGNGLIDFYSELNALNEHTLHELQETPLRGADVAIDRWFTGLPKGGGDNIGQAASSVWWAFKTAMDYGPPDTIVFFTDWQLHSPNREFNSARQTELIKEVLEKCRKKPKLIFFTQTQHGKNYQYMEMLAKMTDGSIHQVK